MLALMAWAGAVAVATLPFLVFLNEQLPIKCARIRHSSPLLSKACHTSTNPTQPT